MKYLSFLMLLVLLSGCMVDFIRNTDDADTDTVKDTESENAAATCTYACMLETTCTTEFGGTVRGELTCADETEICCDPRQGSDTGVDTVLDTGSETETDTESETGSDTILDTGSDRVVDTGSDTGGDTSSDTGVDTGSQTGVDTESEMDSGTHVDTGSDTALDTDSESVADTDSSTSTSLQDLPIEEVIAQTYVLQNFEALLVATRVSQEMQSPPYAVFAPWDYTLDALPYWEEMTGDRGWYGHLRDLTLGHIYEGNLPYEELEDGIWVAMLNGDVAKITIENERPRIDGFRFIGNTAASDGHLYLLQDIREPKWTNRTIMDIIDEGERFTILAQILNQPSMSAKREELSATESRLTFFAPTDEALAGFDILNCTELDCLADLDLLVLNHSVEALVPKLFTPTQTFATQSGSYLDWDYDTQSVTCTNEDETLQEVWLDVIDEEYASNGIVHPIDTLLCTTITPL